MNLHPGDILGVSPGTDALGRAIVIGTLGYPFAWPPAWQGLHHVAIVAPHKGGLAWWESTMSEPSPCAVCGQQHDGVQAHDIAAKIRALTAAGQIVWHYRLRKPLCAWSVGRLVWYCRDKHGTPYDVPGAIAARDLPIGTIKRLLFGQESLERMYCSEFVPAGLRYAGAWQLENATGLSPNRLCRLGVRQEVLAYPGRLYPDGPGGGGVAMEAA